MIVKNDNVDIIIRNENDDIIKKFENVALAFDADSFNITHDNESFKLQLNDNWKVEVIPLKEKDKIESLEAEVLNYKRKIEGAYSRIDSAERENLRLARELKNLKFQQENEVDEKTKAFEQKWKDWRANRDWQNRFDKKCGCINQSNGYTDTQCMFGGMLFLGTLAFIIIMSAICFYSQLNEQQDNTPKARQSCRCCHHHSHHRHHHRHQMRHTGDSTCPICYPH